MWRALVVVLTLALLATASGCGGGEGGDRASIDSMLDRLPGESNEIAAMDLAAIKRRLRLDPEFDPAQYDKRGSTVTPAAMRFDDGVVKVLGYLYGPGRTPAAGAIDHGKLTAAVAADTTGGEQVVILATSQPAGEIERGLATAGLRSSGRGVYVIPDPEVINPLSAAAVRDGLVVLAGSADIAIAALGRRQADPRLASALALLRRARGDLRVVRTYESDEIEADGAPCVRAIAGGQRFEEARVDEDLLVTVSGKPDPGRVILGTGEQRKDILTMFYAVADTTVSGSTLALKIRRRGPDAIDHANAATIAEGEVRPREVYRCPQSSAKPPPPPPSRALPQAAQAQRTGSSLERQVSAFISVVSQASTPVRVSCRRRTFTPNSTLTCSGTRRDGSKLYHYKIVVSVGKDRIDSLDVTSPDDKTGTIVKSEA